MFFIQSIHICTYIIQPYYCLFSWIIIRIIRVTFRMKNHWQTHCMVSLAKSIFMFICLSDVKCQIPSFKYPGVVTENVRILWAVRGQVRDSNGISKLPQIQLISPYKISFLWLSSEIPLLSLDSHLALCGPTLACSNDDEAWIWLSPITPDSMPRGPMQVAENTEQLLEFWI